MIIRTPFSRRQFIGSACLIGAGLAAAGLSPLTALAAPGRTEQQTRLLMGTQVTLTAITPSAAMAEDAFAAAFAEVERQTAIFDRRDGTSALGILNRQGGLADAPPELGAVLDAALRLGLATGQAFNPAVAPLVDMLAAARGGPLPGPADSGFKQILALCAPGGISLMGHRVRLERQGMQLTLDGIAKGHIADAASRVLSRKGLPDHMVNAGGDIRVMGRNASGKAWVIGLRHPDRHGGILTSTSVQSGAIATSGCYENYYNSSRTSHHLVNATTGSSAGISSVTVRAQNTMQADALATALSLMPLPQALDFAEKGKTPCLIVDSQGSIFKSAHWA